MAVEPRSYRARKWALQRLTARRRRFEQHDRLDELDWDVVVVLDACRWDTLQAVTEWPIERCRSPGSATGEWLSVVSETGVFEDASIATANANYAAHDVSAEEIHPIWRTDWNDRLGTVPPEPVLDRANELLRDGSRRVVAHLLPPHAPYIAKVGGTWVPAFPDVDIWKRNPEREYGDKLSPQVSMATGHVDLRRARAGYRASVESTWRAVTEYVGEWVADDHTVVVTADHGETFGRIRDWRLYGHPNGCHVAPLVRVPFVTFEAGERPEHSPDSVEETLQALGYVE